MRLALIIVLSVATRAAALDLSVRAEPSAAFAVSAPQRSYYTAGFGVFAGAQLGLLSILDVVLEGGYVFMARAATSPLPNPGSAVWLGPGARLHTPFATSAVTPWVEVVVAGVRTGDIFRPGFKAAAGVLWPFGAVRLGPRLEVQQIFHLGDEPQYATADVTMITAGLTVELAVLTSAAEATPPPAPEPDSDGDGVRDSVDACPRIAAATRDGCPDQDPDHDGILGKADLCPDQPEDFDGHQDDDGCPELDNDLDGVPDAQDGCPMLAGAAALQGCPDTDRDGVADRFDHCPSVPGPADNSGCPVYKELRVTDTKLELLQKIFFAFAKTSIMPRSYPLLNEVVQAVKDRGNLCLSIEGHTDSLGSLEQNMTLSDGRAAAVRVYLVEHGIPARNLTSQGYGPTLPLEDNRTPEGRERNRRVEFTIVPCMPAPPP